MSAKHCAVVSKQKNQYSSHRRYCASVCLLEVAAKHISKTTAITSVQWHAIYMAVPGEINFAVTTHKINSSERNSGRSSAERNSIITGRELQLTAPLQCRSFLSLDYLYRFICGECIFLMTADDEQFGICQNEEFDLRTGGLSRCPKANSFLLFFSFLVL